MRCLMSIGVTLGATTAAVELMLGEAGDEAYMSICGLPPAKR